MDPHVQAWKEQRTQAQLILGVFGRSVLKDVPNMLRFLFEKMAEKDASVSEFAYILAGAIHSSVHGKKDPLTGEVGHFPMGRDVAVLLKCQELSKSCSEAAKSDSLCEEAMALKQLVQDAIGPKIEAGTVLSSKWKDIEPCQQGIAQIVYPFVLGSRKPLRFLALSELENFIRHNDESGCTKFLTTFSLRDDIVEFATKVGTSPQLHPSAFVDRIRAANDRTPTLIYSSLINAGLLGERFFETCPAEYPFSSHTCLPLAYAKYIERVHEKK